MPLDLLPVRQGCRFNFNVSYSIWMICFYYEVARERKSIVNKSNSTAKSLIKAEIKRAQSPLKILFSKDEIASYKLQRNTVKDMFLIPQQLTGTQT